MAEEETSRTPYDRDSPERTVEALITQDELPPPTKM